MRQTNTTPNCDKKNARKGTNVCKTSNIVRQEKVTQLITPKQVKSPSETVSDKQGTRFVKLPAGHKCL